MKQRKRYNCILYRRKAESPSPNNDGYVLAYALGIIVVLCALVLAIFSVALRNLQTQQQAAEAMAEKYAAEGVVEEILASISSELKANDYDGDEAEESSAKMSAKGAAYGKIRSNIQAIITNINDANSDVLIELRDTDNNGADAMDIHLEKADNRQESIDADAPPKEIVAILPLTISHQAKGASNINATAINVTVELPISLSVSSAPKSKKELKDELGNDKTDESGNKLYDYVYSAHAEVTGPVQYTEYTVNQTVSKEGE